MKIFWGIMVAAALFLQSCEEVGPDINLHGNKSSVSDTTYIESVVETPEPKNVLLEEMTGVRCTNCPQAHQLVAQMKVQYPDRFFSLAYHPINSLGGQYPFSKDTLKNQQSQILFDYFGQIGSEPAGTIDRTLFPSETYLLLNLPKWSNNVANQFLSITPVNLRLNSSFDTATREVTVTAEMHYTSADTQPNKLTIALVENGIVTPQLDGVIIDTFYVHNDVMRQIITDTKGDVIAPTHQAGTVVRKTYKTTVDPAWKAGNMHVVAFVHEYLRSRHVYQTKEVKMKP